MRIGGPHIRPPQWTQRPLRPAGQPASVRTDRPRTATPVERPAPGRVSPRPTVRVARRGPGLKSLGRAGRKIARMLVQAMLGTIRLPARWVGLLLAALWDLIHPTQTRGHATHRRPAASAAPAAQRGPAVHVDGSNGFLFKPRSDSDGKAVVLMPAKLTGKIDHVVLKSPDGQVIDKGRFSGIANGDRAHFRFDRPGGAYPPGTIVEVRLDDGSTRQWKLTNPALRHD